MNICMVYKYFIYTNIYKNEAMNIHMTTPQCNTEHTRCKKKKKDPLHTLSRCNP